MPWPGEQGLATVVFGEFFTTDPLLAAVGFAGQDQRLAVFGKTSQHRRTPVAQQQQHRQVQR